MLFRSVENFQFACQQRGISPAMACLSFLSSVPEVSYAVVGITSCKELEELCEQSKMLMDPAWFEKFGEIDPAIIDPRAWPKK